MRFGVWVEGSSTVNVAADGPSAFRQEARLLAVGVVAWVVVQNADGTWAVVPRWSPVRPSPALPAGPTLRPQRGGVLARVARRVLALAGGRSRADSVRVGPEFRRRLWPR